MTRCVGLNEQITARQSGQHNKHKQISTENSRHPPIQSRLKQWGRGNKNGQGISESRVRQSLPPNVTIPGLMPEDTLRTDRKDL